MQHFQIILGRVDRINYSQPQSTLPHRLPTGDQGPSNPWPGSNLANLFAYLFIYLFLETRSNPEKMLKMGA